MTSEQNWARNTWNDRKYNFPHTQPPGRLDLIKQCIVIVEPVVCSQNDQDYQQRNFRIEATSVDSCIRNW